MNQYHIHVRGLVQGVGFRPYVYRLATEMGLRGYVDNSNDGVFIVLQSTCIQKEKFLKALIKSAPASTKYWNPSLSTTFPAPTNTLSP